MGGCPRLLLPLARVDPQWEETQVLGSRSARTISVQESPHQVKQFDVNPFPGLVGVQKFGLVGLESHEQAALKVGVHCERCSAASARPSAVVPPTRATFWEMTPHPFCMDIWIVTPGWW